VLAGCSVERGQDASGQRQEEWTATTKTSDKKRRPRTRTENDEAPWLVGEATLCCLAVPVTEGIQVDELLRDTVGLAREILRGSAKQI
jgi:hypothetical protein